MPAQDLRFAFRTMKRWPWFTAVVVLILGIGIGANTAMFTLVSDILFTPLPSPDGDRILYLGTSQPGLRATEVSYPDFRDWRARARSFSAMALVEHASFTLGDERAAAEPVSGARLSVHAFRTLGVAPTLGRDFQPGEDKSGADRVVLLGHSVWTRRYGGDPGVVGRIIRVDGAPATVIGVMPKGMRFPMAADLWMPLSPAPTAERRDARVFEAFGKLRTGVSLGEARSEMDVLGAQLATEYPDTNRGVRPIVTPYTRQAVQREMRLLLMALQAAVALLLLIVCANAANLLLSRSLGRTREIAIRSALGANPRLIVRQLLVESVLYAAAGGVLGLVFGYLGVRGFDIASAGVGRPYWLTFGMDYRVFGFFAALVLTTGILFGLGPALSVLRASTSEQLKQGGRTGAGRSSHGLANAFVVTQFALTLVVLIGFGLVGRSIGNIYKRATGFETARVLTLRLRLPERYQHPEAHARFGRELLASVRRLPGVEGAAMASHLPLAGSDVAAMEPEGYVMPDAKPVPVAMVSVSPEYFRTFGIPIRAGRAFVDSDGGRGQLNAIVNQRLAADYWPGQDPLGKRVRVIRGSATDPVTVVGVSADVAQNAASETAHVLYLPDRMEPRRTFSLVLRTSTPPDDLSRPVGDEIRRIEPDVSVARVMTMAEVVRISHWPHRLFGSIFAVFGLVAAGLAGLGLYSVAAYSVHMRTRDIALRMALGATRSDVLWAAMWQGMRQVAVGLPIGVAGAMMATRALGAVLVQISPMDPATFSGMAAFETAVALIACWLPARRAAGVDPLEALRHG